MISAVFKYILLITFCLTYFTISAQLKEPNLNSLAEKIYLSTDKETYNKSSTIWFSCIVVNSGNHKPTNSSEILRVELINSKNETIEKKMIEINHGFASGFFDLIEMEKGPYWIRAYTIWNKNFGDRFISEKKILVYDIAETNSNKVFKNIKLTVLPNSSKKIVAEIFPEQIDSLHKGKLKVNLNFDGEKEEVITLRKTQLNAPYLLEYEIPINQKLVRLAIETKNSIKTSKTIQLQEKIDVQFFPESGNLLNGITSKIGFKAIDVNGKGIEVEGVIYDNDGTKITDFKSNFLGMGSFILQNPDVSKSYYASVAKNGENNNSKYMLPEVKDKGTNIIVKNLKDSIKVSIRSNFNKELRANLQFVTRGITNLVKEIVLENGIYSTALSKQLFLDGICAIKLKDIAQNTMAERLFFIQNNMFRVDLQLFTDKEKYYSRDETRIKVKPQVFGSKDVFHASIKAVLKNELGEDYFNNNNVMSYLLLDSDLKGHIENPGYYFTKGSFKDLDDLLLTQGWSNYNYVEKLSKFSKFPEKNVQVKGLVKSTRNRKSKKEMDLILFPFFKKKKPKIFLSRAKVPGNFTFNLGKMYGDELSVYIQPANKTKKETYSYHLNKPESLQITKNYTINDQIIKPVNDTIIIKNKERRVKEKEFMFLKQGTVVLDEVIVNAKLDIPKRDEIIKIYGKPDVQIPGEEIIEKAKSWNSGVLQVLKFNYADKVFVSRNPRTGGLSVKAIGGLREANFIMVDGIFVRIEDYNLVEFIDPEEIVRFEVIEDSSIPAYRKAYLATYGRQPLFGPFDGNIIVIYTKTGEGLHSAVKAKEVKTTFKIPVLSENREYYTPKYDYDITEEDWANLDVRTLLYWNPKIALNNKEFTEISFYNSDVEGTVLIMVEILGKDGKIGYKVLEYDLANTRM